MESASSCCWLQSFITGLLTSCPRFALLSHYLLPRGLTRNNGIVPLLSFSFALASSFLSFLQSPLHRQSLHLQSSLSSVSHSFSSPSQDHNVSGLAAQALCIPRALTQSTTSSSVLSCNSLFTASLPQDHWESPTRAVTTSFDSKIVWLGFVSWNGGLDTALCT